MAASVGGAACGTCAFLQGGSRCEVTSVDRCSTPIDEKLGEFHGFSEHRLPGHSRIMAVPKELFGRPLLRD